MIIEEIVNENGHFAQSLLWHSESVAERKFRGKEIKKRSWELYLNRLNWTSSSFSFLLCLWTLFFLYFLQHSVTLQPLFIDCLKKNNTVSVKLLQRSDFDLLLCTLSVSQSCPPPLRPLFQSQNNLLQITNHFTLVLGDLLYTPTFSPSRHADPIDVPASWSKTSSSDTRAPPAPRNPSSRHSGI